MVVDGAVRSVESVGDSGKGEDGDLGLPWEDQGMRICWFVFVWVGACYKVEEGMGLLVVVAVGVGSGGGGGCGRWWQWVLAVAVSLLVVKEMRMRIIYIYIYIFFF